MDFIVPYNLKKIYSTKYQAEQINKLILKYIDNKSIITDATSCIGGNSYLFCSQFKLVNCVENNNINFNILKRNLNSFSNKTMYNCSYNIIKFCLKQDAVFIDPPWGGNVYKKFKNIDLYLDEINVIDIINELYNYCRIVCLKVPNNFNFKIESNFWYYRLYDIKFKNKNIYKIIIFYKN